MKIYLPDKRHIFFFFLVGRKENQLSSMSGAEERKCPQEMRYEQNEPRSKVQQEKEFEARYDHENMRLWYFAEILGKARHIPQDVERGSSQFYLNLKGSDDLR